MECPKVKALETKDCSCSEIRLKPPVVSIDVESFKAVLVDGVEYDIKSVLEADGCLVILFRTGGTMTTDDPAALSAYEDYKNKKHGI